MPTFHTLTISHTRTQPDGLAISFAVPTELKEEYEFKPGQYLTLRAEINGEDLRRSYSICSHHLSDNLEVGIKRVTNGLFSTFACGLKVGDQLQVMTPQGRFTADIGGRHNYLLIAAGSGITPCLAITKSVLHGEPESQLALLCGNRNTMSIMFRDDIDDLKNQYTARFALSHILTAEQQDANILNGRINTEKLKNFNEKGLIDVSACDAIFLCGPQAMTDNCLLGLEALGVEKDKIKIELFTTDGSTPRKPLARKPLKSQSGTPVTIILDGAERTVRVNDETVLRAAQREGLDLPFSCAGGMCCTCRCKVKAGKTAMDMNFSLADWEIDAGYTLACQTRPASNDVVLDFDAI